jgi:signal transduction histidine kinase
MSSIHGYAEICIKKPELTKKDQKEYLEIILHNSKRANKLLTELFELSQMDSPEFSLKSEKTDLCEYLRQACGDLVPQFEETGFAYEFTIPEESVFALLDADRFSRIIGNLAENALRYNPQGTTISINMAIENHYALIDFSDNGIGIPPHLADNVFKPFISADDARSSKAGGSGLGLSIAQKNRRGPRRGIDADTP